MKHILEASLQRLQILQVYVKFFVLSVNLPAINPEDLLVSFCDYFYWQIPRVSSEGFQTSVYVWLG